MGTHLRYWLPRLALFFAPLIVVTAAVVGLAVYSGEAMPLAMVHAVQEADPSVVYRPRARETLFAYKLMGVERRRPQVVVVGSSRVLRITGDVLTRAPETFYNAGISAMRLPEIAAFLDQLTPETAPAVLIVGIDQAWFNAEASVPDAPPPSGGEIGLDLWLRQVRRVAQEIGRGATRLPVILSGGVGGSRALGLAALNSGTGYAGDGSVPQSPGVSRRSQRIAAGDPDALADLTRSLARSRRPGQHVSDTALATMDAILTRAEALDIALIGVALPLHPLDYAERTTNPAFAYFAPSMAALNTLFGRHSAQFIDLSDPASVGGASADFPDGIHATEQMSARIFVQIAAAAPALHAYTDPDALAVTLTASP